MADFDWDPYEPALPPPQPPSGALTVDPRQAAQDARDIAAQRMIRATRPGERQEGAITAWTQHMGNQIADLPGRLWNEAISDPQGFAANMVGPGEIGGGPLLGTVLKAPIYHGSEELALKPSITAYHGSPHDFDRFDISKIGTGEGAQTYGHGLYFADNEGVAKSYRDSLSTPSFKVEGKTYKKPLEASEAIWNLPGLPEDARYELGWHINRNYPINEALSHLEKTSPASHAAAREAIKSGRITEIPNAGRMYQVSINADPAHFLDWDAPVSEQSPHVRDTLLRMGVPDKPHVTGDLAYHHLVGDEIAEGRVKPQSTTAGNRGYQVVSDKLREAGVPGIKYYDALSRRDDAAIDADIARHEHLIDLHKDYADNPDSAKTIAAAQERIAALKQEKAQPQTRNYVVFHHDLVDILKKYGIAGIAALPALGAYHYQDQDFEPQR